MGSTRLGQNNYGKSGVRFMKVSRAPDGRHDITELTVDISLEGEFDAVHEGDNTKCLPTDTMKNTVYALGKDHPIQTIESFAHDLAHHFLTSNRQVSKARVRISRAPWERVSLSGVPHTHTFTQGSGERAVCMVVVDRAGVDIEAGIEGLVILKTTDSAFAGFPRDRFTTLKETEDRIFATSLAARWPFRAGIDPASLGPARESIRTALIATFAAHKSKSVQHTLHEMGKAALANCSQARSIRLSMPNKHCLLVDLTPFGLENRDQVFVPTDQPYGLIEATIERQE
jgi:urate oxidase